MSDPVRPEGCKVISGFEVSDGVGVGVFPPDATLAVVFEGGSRSVPMPIKPMLAEIARKWLDEEWTRSLCDD